MAIIRAEKRTLQEKYQIYLQSDDWKEKSSEARKRARHRCEVCGCKSPINVHHLRYGDWFNVDVKQDLVVLCESCHEMAHAHKVLNVSRRKALNRLKKFRKPKKVRKKKKQAKKLGLNQSSANIDSSPERD